ncbi:MAG: acetyl-CoA acetyltransferase [bacterium]
MGGALRDGVAVVGMGCTRFGELWSKGIEDLIIEAAFEALEDASMEPKDIEAVWAGTLRSGMSGTVVADSLKLRNIPITRVENHCASGHEAFRNAAFGVASGMYDRVMAIGYEKLKDSGFPGMGVGRPPHPAWMQLWTAPTGFGFIAGRYFHEHGLGWQKGREILARIAVKNHENGSRAPKAHLRNPVTMEQVLKAPVIAWPLGLFDCCGTSDGASAAILVRADRAREVRTDPVHVRGIGLSVEPTMPYFRTGFDYLGFEATRSAARQAYGQAGIRDPRREIQIAEVHDCFTITELVNYEDLGFSPRGQGWRDVLEGTFHSGGGALPVNTDGGLKCFGHPVGASGLRMLYEIYKQLQGKAEGRQVPDVRTGLAHTLGGPPQVSCVVIVSNEPNPSPA